MNRMLRIALLLLAVSALSACGFHLRKSVALPPTMAHMHIDGDGNLQRALTRALEHAGVDVVDQGGTGVAELTLPVNAFNTESLTQGGYARITEFAVHYQVAFDVTQGGKTLVPRQDIAMQREYSYDATDSVGNASQVQQIQQSLVTDMVQAIMFRLEAAGRQPAPVAKP
ncbi:MAG: hypothetical protein EPN56_09540 [Rhodanobacter sp.]|nr:MAG: hypothetical protein EPN78_05115 [Rhodanobacter sp.]TAM13454.1 MAG: hypothetical protein EPN66_04045 [Rhodanobacter sp.]TAM35793.1 MAG: hypothetical protein EPN56_09540 [Rhodanobacter sp.]